MTEKLYRQRQEQVLLLRIYAAPLYAAMLWAPWAIKSTSFLGSSQRLATGWELTKGFPLFPLGLIVAMSIVQYAVRVPRLRSAVHRLLWQAGSALLGLCHLFASLFLLVVTLIMGDGESLMKLFQSFSDFQAGFYAAQAVAGSYVQNKDGMQGRLSRISHLEWLLALHPVEKWRELADTAAAGIMQEPDNPDAFELPQIYVQYGGWRQTLRWASSADKPSAPADHLFGLRAATFNALRKHNLLARSLDERGLDGLQQALLDDFRRQSAQLDRVVLRAVELGDERVFSDEMYSDLDLPPSIANRAIVKALLEKNGIGSARTAARFLSNQQHAAIAKGEHVSDEQLRETASLLALTHQFYLARSLALRLDPNDQIAIDAILLDSFSQSLAQADQDAAAKYVALYRSKDRELGLRRSSTIRLQSW